MIHDIINIVLRFFILILVQALILNNIQLGGYVNPYLYVLFILLLPLQTPKWLLLFLGLILGLSIDMFSNTMGMHAFATVFMSFCRPMVLKIMSPREGYDFENKLNVRDMGISWFVTYSGILVLLHHFVLFYLEVFRFSEFFSTFIRVILSSFLTLILIVISQYLFSKSKSLARKVV